MSTVLTSAVDSVGRSQAAGPAMNAGLFAHDVLRVLAGHLASPSSAAIRLTLGYLAGNDCWAICPQQATHSARQLAHDRPRTICTAGRQLGQLLSLRYTSIQLCCYTSIPLAILLAILLNYRN